MEQQDQSSIMYSGRTLGTLTSGSATETTSVSTGTNRCANINFEEQCAEGKTNLSIGVDPQFYFISTFNSATGVYETWNQCDSLTSIDLADIPVGDTIEISGVCDTPIVENGDGTRPWEKATCGNDAIAADTSIYFFYDLTSFGEEAMITSARAAVAWVNTIPNFAGEVFHIQIQGERWIQWAEVPKTGFFGGLFSDDTSKEVSIDKFGTGNYVLTDVANTINYSGNGNSIPYNFDLEQSFDNYESNEPGVLWNEQNILAGITTGTPLNPGVVYDGIYDARNPNGINLQSSSRNVLVVGIADESHCNQRNTPNNSQIGWSDYHIGGPGNNVTGYESYLGVVTPTNWGKLKSTATQAAGWPKSHYDVSFTPVGNNLNTVLGSVNNSSIFYRDDAHTGHTSASSNYVYKDKYFEAWKLAAFYTGTDPYNGEVTPTLMEHETQWNLGTFSGFSASWERDCRRFKFLYNNYKQGLTGTTYAEDVLDGFAVDFITYVGKPAVPNPTHIPFPLHVVAAITDNATYTGSSGTSVTTTGGLIEDSNLPYNGLWDEFSEGAITTLKPLTYVSAGSASNGQNPYFDSGLGQLSAYRWGYNIDQNISIGDIQSWTTKFSEDLNELLVGGTSCDGGDCLRILVVDQDTGLPINNFQVAIPEAAVSPLITDASGQLWYDSLSEGAYNIMGCFPFNSSGSCTQHSMKISLNSVNHTVEKLCTEGCTDPNACNYDPNAGVDDGSCWYVESPCTCEDGGEESFVDDCGYCVGGNTGLEANFAKDDCDVCDGENLDKDICGECFGTGGDCAGCTDPLSNNYDPTATIDDGSCECSIPYYECILKEMAKEIVEDCSDDCYGENCNPEHPFLYEDFKTLDSLLTSVKAYNRGICSEGSVAIIQEAMKTIKLLTSDWNCSNCKNC